ncbi:SAC3 domain-containing protein 1 [Amia ocellicauda]|uniref:SAC3 domain-containing protein 1 n=1 Tax=Amia ocellicauda TaxID=2972642 RepID=UPI003463E971
MSRNVSSRAWHPRRRVTGPGGDRTSEDGWRQETQKETVPQGSCLLMCPAAELREREAQRRLHRFEVLPGTERQRLPRADPTRTVKEYSRPAAGKDCTRPADLRPPAVLYRTVCYLVDNIASSAGLQPWNEVYDFVFDRLRSVRQDMVIQRVGGEACVSVLERTVRFLLYAEYRLSGEPLRCFDPQINRAHLRESLAWLLGCYQLEPGLHSNQEEFEALCLLYNLGSLDALRHALCLPEKLRGSPGVRLALAVNRAFLERNPVRLLRLARPLPFLHSCALHPHLTRCRRDLLLLYSHGLSSRNGRFPLPRLAELLGLGGGSQAAELCQAHGVEVSGDWAVFNKGSFKEAERQPDGGSSYELVGCKQGDRSLASIIHGEP